jgi:hypothetical protein
MAKQYKFCKKCEQQDGSKTCSCKCNSTKKGSNPALRIEKK